MYLFHTSLASPANVHPTPPITFNLQQPKSPMKDEVVSKTPFKPPFRSKKALKTQATTLKPHPTVIKAYTTSLKPHPTSLSGHQTVIIAHKGTLTPHPT